LIEVNQRQRQQLSSEKSERAQGFNAPAIKQGTR